MNEKAAQLIAVLNNLIELHRELAGIEQKKISSIIEQDWKGLEKLVSHSRKLLKEIDKAEKARLKLIEGVGLDRESRLIEVAENFPPDLAEQVLERGAELRLLIEELSRLNRRAESLIQSSLEILNFSISLFSGAGAAGKTYGGSGQERNVGEKHTALVFDVKA